MQEMNKNKTTPLSSRPKWIILQGCKVNSKPGKHSHYLRCCAFEHSNQPLVLQRGCSVFARLWMWSRMLLLKSSCWSQLTRCPLHSAVCNLVFKFWDKIKSMESDLCQSNPNKTVRIRERIKLNWAKTSSQKSNVYNLQTNHLFV